MALTTTQQPLVYRALGETPAMRMTGYILLVLAGSLLIAIAGQIKVPFWPVPVTMQTLAIFTIAAAYGSRLAVVTLLAYLAEGAIGLPVFTNGGGLGYFATSATTGYLIAFVIAAGLTGYAADRGWARNPFALFGVNLVGTIIILALGFAWIAVHPAFGLDKAFAWGVGPFIYSDILKAAIAACVIPAAASLLGRK
ncbi:MAG: biotin transporter BioY [Pseudomonadota bacterium]